jgi:hypothetical protein
MDAEGREALATIRDLVDRDRYQLTVHFRQRLAQRGMFWSDILLILEEPDDVRENGEDDEGAERWIISGDAGLGAIDFVVAIDHVARFVTLFWS